MQIISPKTQCHHRKLPRDVDRRMLRRRAGVLAPTAAAAAAAAAIAFFGLLGLLAGDFLEALPALGLLGAAALAFPCLVRTHTTHTMAAPTSRSGS